MVQKRQFEEHVDYLRSIGEPVSIAGISDAIESNPEQNFAETSIVRFFRGLEIEESEKSWNTPVNFDLKTLHGYTNPTEKRSVSYIFTPPVQAHFPDITPEEAREKFEDFYTKHSAAISALEESVRLPDCRFPIDLNDEMISPLFEYTNPFMKFSHLVSTRGRHHLEKGNITEAAYDAETIILLSERIFADHFILPQIVGYIFLQQGISIIQQGLAQSLWSNDQMRTFDELLSRFKLQTNLLKAIRDERVGWFEFGYLDKEGRDKVRKSGLDLNGNFHPLIPSGWYYDNFTKASELLQLGILSDASGNRAINHLPASSTIERLMTALNSEHHTRIRYRLAANCIPNYGVLFDRALRTETYIHHARIAIALEKFRKNKGTFPTDVSQISPPLPVEITTDPFSKSPMRYKLLASDSYEIYSVGANKVDDGGQIRWRLNDGDWVWRLSLPEDFDYSTYR